MKILLAFLVSITALSTFAQVPPHMRCEMPRSVQCENFVNSNLSRWDVRDEYVQRRLRNACAGNEEALCVTNSAQNLPWYDLKDTNDMLQVATSCKLTRMSCVNYITERISKYEFNEPNEISEVNRACARADADCVHQACNSREHNCRSKNGLMRAAMSCFESCWPR